MQEVTASAMVGFKLDEHLQEFLRSRQSVKPTPPRRRKTKVYTGKQYF